MTKVGGVGGIGCTDVALLRAAASRYAREPLVVVELIAVPTG